MPSRTKENLHVFWRLISLKNLGPRKLLVVLSVCTFVLLLTSHFLSLSRNGGYHLAKEKWTIIISCGVLIEILNQVTYWYGHVHRKAATILKGVVFWLIFVVGIGVYIYLLVPLPETVNWKWSSQIGPVIVYIIFSWALPIYSFCPNIRFLFLYGRFAKKRL
jgi:hypothetical protein